MIKDKRNTCLSNNQKQKEQPMKENRKPRRNYAITSDNGFDLRIKATDTQASRKLEKISNDCPSVQFDLYEQNPNDGYWSWVKTHVSSDCFQVETI